MGADVIVMAADHHDAVLAQTSHLPHLLAYTLVDVLAGFGDGREVFDYAAGGLGISLALRRQTQKCGATYSCPIRRRCSD